MTREIGGVQGRLGHSGSTSSRRLLLQVKCGCGARDESYGKLIMGCARLAVIIGTIIPLLVHYHFIWNDRAPVVMGPIGKWGDMRRHKVIIFIDYNHHMRLLYCDEQNLNDKTLLAICDSTIQRHAHFTQNPKLCCLFIILVTEKLLWVLSTNKELNFTFLSFDNLIWMVVITACNRP